MLMGGDERDPPIAGTGKKKPNVRLLPLHPAVSALIFTV